MEYELILAHLLTIFNSDIRILRSVAALALGTLRLWTLICPNSRLLRRVKASALHIVKATLRALDQTNVKFVLSEASRSTGREGGRSLPHEVLLNNVIRDTEMGTCMDTRTELNCRRYLLHHMRPKILPRLPLIRNALPGLRSRT